MDDHRPPTARAFERKAGEDGVLEIVGIEFRESDEIVKERTEGLDEVASEVERVVRPGMVNAKEVRVA